MKFNAQIIASFLNGTIDGDPNTEVSGISKIEEGQKGTLSFLANPKYSKYLYTTDSSIVLINKDFQLEQEIKTTLIRVDDAYSSFAKLMELYLKQKYSRIGISSKSSISESAKLGNDLYIGHNVVIENNVKIGDNVKIYPNVYIGNNVKIDENTIILSNVTIFDDTIIGKNCMIHAGAVIGDDGFGNAQQADGSFKRIAQIGNVIIEDDVEIGSNTCVDRATLGSTIIKKGARIDNLIQIAHNVIIGKHTAIAAQTGVSGSAEIGDYCMLGGQVGIVGHLKIANKNIITAKSAVAGNITKENQVLQGIPAIEIMKAKRAIVVYKDLPQLQRTVYELEKQIRELKSNLLK